MIRKILPILFLTVTNMLSGTMLIPVLPFVVRESVEDAASATVYGFLIALYYIFQFFGAPILGGLSDRYGRKPILLLSQIGTLASWFIFAAAFIITDNVLVTLPLIIIGISRVVDGITGGNSSVANAYLADITTDEERTTAFGILGAAAGMTLMVGPALGSLSAASDLGYLGTALLAIIINLVTVIVMFLYLKESLAPEDRIEDVDLNPFHQLNMIGRIQKLTHVRSLSRLFSLRVFLTFAITSYTTVNVLWYTDRLGLSQTEVGLFMLFVGSFVIIDEIVLLPFFEKRFGDLGTLIIGALVLPIGLILVMFPETVLAFIPASFILTMGLALTFPTLQSVITKVADKRQEGEVQGIDTSLSAALSALAPLVAGVLYAQMGGQMFIVLAVIALIGFLIVYLNRGVIDEEMPHPNLHPESRYRETRLG